jgi:hypothetical protein
MMRGESGDVVVRGGAALRWLKWAAAKRLAKLSIQKPLTALSQTPSQVQGSFHYEAPTLGATDPDARRGFAAVHTHRKSLCWLAGDLSC